MVIEEGGINNDGLKGQRQRARAHLFARSPELLQVLVMRQARQDPKMVVQDILIDIE